MKSDFKKFYDLVARHVLEVNFQVSAMKEAILYQLFADKLHCFVCGYPSSGAKSSFRSSLKKICPSFAYVLTGGWTTKIGIGENIKRVREGLIMLDEINKLSSGDVGIMYDILQFQVLKVDKCGMHHEYPAKVNILGLCNPKPHGKWHAFGNVDVMREQLPVNQALMRRFHINIFLRDYTPEEFDKVNRFKENVHNPVISPEDTNWFQEQIIQKRAIQPKGRVPEKVYNFLKNLKIFKDDIITPVTPELFEGILQIAIARARIRGSDVISKSDWRKTLEFYVKCLRTSGLTNRLIEKKLMRG